MNRPRHRRPSASMIVVLLALAVALAGSAGAAGVPAWVGGLLDGKKIRPRSIPANRLRPGSLTGRQVREATLGTVPSARTAETAARADIAAEARHAVDADTAAEARHAAGADTATQARHADTAAEAAHAAEASHAASADTAADAASLGGVPAAGYLAAGETARYSAAMDAGDPARTLASMGPLTLSATCSQSAGKTVAVLRARSGADGVVVRGQALAAGESAAIQTVEFSPGVPFEAFTAFSATDASQSFAIQGVPVVMVNTLGKDCRFIGTLIEVAPR